MYQVRLMVIARATQPSLPLQALCGCLLLSTHMLKLKAHMKWQGAADIPKAALQAGRLVGRWAGANSPPCRQT